MTYVRDQLSEHVSLLPLSAPLAVAWLSHRLAGRPVRDRTVTSLAGQPEPRISRRWVTGPFRKAGTASTPKA